MATPEPTGVHDSTDPVLACPQTQPVSSSMRSRRMRAKRYVIRVSTSVLDRRSEPQRPDFVGPLPVTNR